MLYGCGGDFAKLLLLLLLIIIIMFLKG